MSTLKTKQFKQLDNTIENSKGIKVNKDDVLKIIVNELKKRDEENKFIVDTFTTSCLKDVYNKLINL